MLKTRVSREAIRSCLRDFVKCVQLLSLSQFFPFHATAIHIKRLAKNLRPAWERGWRPSADFLMLLIIIFLGSFAFSFVKFLMNLQDSEYNTSEYSRCSPWKLSGLREKFSGNTSEEICIHFWINKRYLENQVLRFVAFKNYWYPYL